jgi:hypothetical protein
MCVKTVHCEIDISLPSRHVQGGAPDFREHEEVAGHIRETHLVGRGLAHARAILAGKRWES